MPVIVTRDGRDVSPPLPDENAAFAWLLNHQGQSAMYALEHGGYALRTVETLEPGAHFDHGARTVQQLDADVIRLAVELGWRGADAQDCRDIRRLLAVASGDASPDYFHVGADDMAISEHLSWVADDATSWIDERHAPERHWVGNDGERGAWGVWPIEDDELAG